MNEQTFISKEITFWDLLKSNEIVIPKIQRDFAQGRNDEKIKIIRTSILDKFKTILSDENEKLSLDFVYGSNENSQIIPLDGQQRLTTLFLLHLFLSKISGQCNDDNKAVFKKFKYEIRSSTQKFINALIENELVDDIENQSWFFNSWKKDPTVKAMLVMLSEISKQFKNEEVLWDKLINNEKITFYYLPLDKFKLTDELYVKMNSRGKSLSDFENFKAWLDEELQKRNEELQKDWSFKLDTIWTDLFWNTDNGDFSIDDEMMSFFKNMALFNYVENKEEIETDKEKKEFYNKITILKDAKSYISNQEFEKYYFIEDGQITIFEQITLFFDRYIKHRDIILKAITFWSKDVDIFKRFIQEDTFESKALFYGLYQFVLKSDKLDEENFNDFIRILRNLVENTNIGSENLKNILNSTKELANLEDVLKGIEEIKLIGFDGNQIAEEKLKAKLIEHNPDWKDVLIEAENHLLFRGNISFLLLENRDSILDKFIQRKSVAINLFDEKGVSIGKESNLLARIMLALGLDLIENGLWLGGRYNQYWKDHLKNKFINPFILEIIDLLLNKNLENFEEILKNEIQKIIESKSDLPNWKLVLIENPILFEGYSGYGRVKKDGRGINIYEQEKFNSNSNAILIENNRNEVITEFIEKFQFELKNSNIKKCKQFYTGEDVILLKNEITLIFKKEILIVKLKEESLEKEYNFTKGTNDFLSKLIEDLNFYGYSI
jgi:hypothetical protein